MDQRALPVAAADGSSNVVEDAGPVALHQCYYDLCVTSPCCDVEGNFTLLSSKHREIKTQRCTAALSCG